MKHILIPIDFKIESLNTLKMSLANNPGEKMQVTLLYAYHLTDSITSLLFYYPSRIIQSLKNPEFEEAISIIKNRFESQIVSINIELFHGTNTNAFINFIEAKKVDVIYIPKSYKLNHRNNGFDIISFVKKSQIQYVELDWSTSMNGSDSEQINSLFN